MRTGTRTLIACSAFVLAVAGYSAAPAASAPDAAASADMSSQFHAMDQNQDGKIARSEVPKDMPLLRNRFTSYDANGDGMLDMREFATAEKSLQGGGHAMGSQTPAAPKPHDSAHPGG